MNSNRFVKMVFVLFVFTQLSISSQSAVVRPPKTLTDPLATNESKSLLSFLVDNYGQKVLSGQQELSEIDYIYSVTGKTPAVGVFDLMDYSPSRIEYGADPTGDVESYISWSNTGGGIVSLSWHWNAPTDLNDVPGEEWWRGFYTFATTFDIAATLADPDGENYQLIIRDLDAIAAELQKFEDAGIPVLWRPLHEASGGWFWWGAQGPAAFIELWQLMYDRYVNYHGLHNLIWVYTVGDPAWYPGDNYVDIVGRDIYTVAGSSMLSEWTATQSIHEGTKLVALSESGTVPNPDQIREYGVWWSWFSVWSGGFIHDVDPTYLTTVYHDEDIITLDELIDWKNYPVNTSPPAVSITGPLEADVFAVANDITISANASDTDGSITKVEFFADGVKIGEDTASPYNFVWTDAALGYHVITAAATDNDGIVTDSEPVNITVGNPAPPIIDRYEAEDAVSDGPILSTNYPGYSGSGSRFFNSDFGTGVTFTVTSEREGDFPLTIRYLIPSGWGDKANDVYVNGTGAGSPNFTNTNSSWTDFDFGEISLNAGTNTVRIAHNWGYIYVDCIELEFQSFCPYGDLDGSCDVDINDLRIMAQSWLDPYDLNDLAEIYKDWLQ